ncbi:MAG TPA: DEAD/DEAH box helicase, partial [Aminivibrio sp.]
METSAGFSRLTEGVRRWVWKQGWPSLREIQEMALLPVLDGKEDVILSAATAGGKTEAAFLPACTRMAESSLPGTAILYVSPLKALINDQARRLESLCGSVGFPVTPWHGDAPDGGKNALRKNPRGVLLITPESLESLLMNSPSWCGEAFTGLVNVIVDEFHAFLGTERGCQLQSLLRRTEFLIGRTVPRIALSATLGEMEKAASALRPEKTLPCRILVSEGKGSELLLQVRGYRTPRADKGVRPGLPDELVQDAYRLLRGDSHLLFTNSRSRTEELAAALSALCDRNFVPNEFFPHHGSLAPDLRRSLEERLQKKDLPTTAVCTSTLELGIDIGSVASIGQVGEPGSASGLRQRLGRSGRRGAPAVLRVFVEEDETGPDSHPADALRLSLVQTAAVLSLLLRKWREPPREGLYHLSTLVQQTLSVIAQYGGVRADQLWTLLCGTGPFRAVGKKDYGDFLRGLGEKHALSQLG